MFAVFQVSLQKKKTVECQKDWLKKGDKCLPCPFMAVCNGGEKVTCRGSFLPTDNDTTCYCNGTSYVALVECKDQPDCSGSVSKGCKMQNYTLDRNTCLDYGEFCTDCYINDSINGSECARIKLDNGSYYTSCSNTTVCQPNYNLTDSCMSCNDGFDFSDNCKSCLPGKGFNSQKDKCLDCKSDQAIVDSICQDCTGNFVVNPSTRLCTDCKNEWTGAQCDICKDGFKLIIANNVKSCIKCIEPNTGLYPNKTECNKCQNGETITNGFCVACPNSNYTSSLENKFECVCKPNHNSTNQCQTCVNHFNPAKSCIECLPGFILSSNCTKCKENFVNDSTCRTCKPGYKYIESIDSCIKCDVGYGWNEQKNACSMCQGDQENVDNICQDCQNNHAVDNSTKTCIICKPNYNLTDNCSSCNKGFDLQTGCQECLNNNYVDFNNSKKDKKCDTCKGGWQLSSASNCTLCGEHFNKDCTACEDKTYTLIAGKCVICKANQLISADGTCLNCPLPDRQLNVNGVCTNCPGNLILSSAFECSICAVGSFLDPKQNCTQCVDNYTMVNGTCKKCNVGFGLNEGGSCVPCTGNTQTNPANNKCEPCPGNWKVNPVSKKCDLCTNHYTVASKCEACAENFTLASKCAACSVNHTGATCDTCKTNYSAADNCTRCEPHHDLSQNCSACDKNWDIEKNCKVCLGQNFDEMKNCLECKDGYTKFDDKFGVRCIKCETKDNVPFGYDKEKGECVKCGEFETVVNNVCQDCPDNKTFNPVDQYKCTKCQPNFDINNGCKNCSAGFTYVNATKRCQNCPTEHTGLNDEGVCKDCLGNQEVTDNKCVDCKNSKEDGFWILGGDKRCNKCKDNFSSSSQCKECESGYQIFNIKGEFRCIQCQLGFGYNIVTDKCEPCGNKAEVVNMVCSPCNGNYEVGSDFKCSVCKNGFTLESNCTTCESSFTYFNSTLCVKCNLTHGLTDTSKGQCVPCGEQEVVDNKCTPCDASKHLIYNKEQHTCDACMVNYSFSKINGVRQCTCNENFNTACNDCKNESFNYYNGQCSMCDPGYAWNDGECKLCEGNSEPQLSAGSANQVCVNCVGNIILDDNKRCQACHPGYNFSDKCLSCLESYEKVDETLCKQCVDHTGLVGRECVECNDSSETVNNYCKQCPPHFILDANKKCTLCEAGYDLNVFCSECKENYDAGQNCQQCSGNYELSKDCLQCKTGYDPATKCTTCTVPGRDPANNCGETSCINDFDSAEKCIKCKPGFVMTDKGNKCLACGPRGYINQEKEECAFCEGLTEVSGAGCRDCPDTGKYQINNTTGKCECQPNFDPKQGCSMCVSNYTLQSDKCLQCTESNHGFMDNVTQECRLCPTDHSVVNNRCVPCANNIVDSTDGKRCSVCKSGFKDYPKCVQCSDHFLPPFLCEACELGYTLAQGGKVCKKCDPGYIVNTKNGECIKCGDDEEVINNTCVSCDKKSGNWSLGPDKTCSVCDLGFDIKTDCKDCRENFDCKGDGNETGFPCKENYTFVVEKNECVQCPVGQGIVDGVCEPCNLTSQNENNYCRNCSHGFIVGQDSLMCDTCPLGQELYNGDCILVINNKSTSNKIWILIIVAIIVTVILIVLALVYLSIRKKRRAAKAALAAEMARPDAAHGPMLDGDDQEFDGPDLMNYTNNSISLDDIDDDDDVEDDFGDDEDPDSGLEESSNWGSENDEEDWMDDDESSSKQSGPSVEDI